MDRGRWGCRTPDGTRVTAMRARELGRRPVVVGDRVRLAGDASGAPGTLARIVAVAERRSVLRRTPEDTEAAERVVVANAELLVVVVSLADPPPSVRLVDRALVAALDGGLRPLLCLTKRDLVGPDGSAALVDVYGPLGVQVLTTAAGRGTDAARTPGADADAEPDDGLGDLRAAVAGTWSVFFGSSGVGKSTLVNRLVPSADRAVGEVSGVGKGRHTSSSAVALELPDGGVVVDTPGVRSLGLGAVTTAGLLAAFPRLAEAAEHCPPGCGHARGAPGCALDAAVVAGDVAPARLSSLRRLLASRRGSDGR